MINDILKQRLAHNYPSMICHPKGWNSIVEELHEELIKIEPNYRVAQTKEKFGALRFYIELPEDTTKERWRAVHDIIATAEKDSLKICENCGNPGELRSGSWIRTLCDRCDQERKPYKG